MTVTGSTTAASTAELWFHGELPAPPTVRGDGIGAATVEAQPGGYRVTVPVQPGSYRIEIR